jgi:hypothetical protein
LAGKQKEKVQGQRNGKENETRILHGGASARWFDIILDYGAQEVEPACKMNPRFCGIMASYTAA